MPAALPSRQAVASELAAEGVRSFGEIQFHLIGGSMLPSLCPGDTLVVQRASLAEVRAGDVVQFLRGGRLVTHRVRKIEDRRQEIGDGRPEAQQNRDHRGRVWGRIISCGGFRTRPAPVENRRQLEKPPHTEKLPHARVHEIPETALITQGDAVRRPDFPVSAEELVGRVVAVTRNGRPVDPSFTVYRQAIAWVLRRSTFALRVWMKLHRTRVQEQVQVRNRVAPVHYK